MKIDKIFELAGIKKTQELEEDLLEIVHYTEFLDSLSAKMIVSKKNYLHLRKDEVKESIPLLHLAPRRKKNLIKIPLVQDV